MALFNLSRLASHFARGKAAFNQGRIKREQQDFDNERELARERLNEAFRRDQLEARNQQAAESQAFREQQLAQQRALAEENRSANMERLRLQLDERAAQSQRDADLRREMTQMNLEGRENLARLAVQLRGAGGARTGTAAPGDVVNFDDEKKLRDEFNTAGRGDASTHREIARAYQTIRSSASLGTPQGDLALMYGLVRMFDPGSVVREGEMATLQKSASIPQSLSAEMQRYIGEGRQLPPEVRARYLQVAEELARGNRRAFRSTIERYSRLAAQSGLNPSRIVDDPYEVLGPMDLMTPQGGRTRGRSPSDDLRRIREQR